MGEQDASTTRRNGPLGMRLLRSASSGVGGDQVRVSKSPQLFSWTRRTRRKRKRKRQGSRKRRTKSAERQNVAASRLLCLMTIAIYLISSSYTPCIILFYHD